MPVIAGQQQALAPNVSQFLILTFGEVHRVGMIQKDGVSHARINPQVEIACAFRQFFVAAHTYSWSMLALLHESRTGLEPPGSRPLVVINTAGS